MILNLLEFERTGHDEALLFGNDSEESDDSSTDDDDDVSEDSAKDGMSELSDDADEPEAEEFLVTEFSFQIDTEEEFTVVGCSPSSSSSVAESMQSWLDVANGVLDDKPQGTRKF